MNKEHVTVRLKVPNEFHAELMQLKYKLKSKGKKHNLDSIILECTKKGFDVLTDDNTKNYSHIKTFI